MTTVDKDHIGMCIYISALNTYYVIYVYSQEAVTSGRCRLKQVTNVSTFAK